MKFRNLFLGMLACAGMVACSNEDLVDNSADSSLMNGKKGYIGVSIVSPSNSSRGVDDPFEAGSEEENAVNNALFLFFGDDGTQVLPSKLVSGDDLKDWEPGTNSVDKISNTVLVLENPTAQPTKMVAILNVPTDNDNAMINKIGNMTLSQLSSQNEKLGIVSPFAMSNSVYYDSQNNKIVATPLKGTDFKSDRDVAKANPVTIPVERVVAKVTVSLPTSISVTTDNNVDATWIGQEPVIDGWNLVSTSSESYWVKNLENNGSWNDYANLRSYWGTSAVSTKLGVKPGSISKLTQAYCLENTTTAPTYVFIVATLNDGKTFLEYNGIKYQEQDLKNKLASFESMKQYYTRSGDEGNYTYTTLDAANNIVFNTNDELKDYEVYASLNSDYSEKIFVKADGLNFTEKSKDAVNATLKEFGAIKEWKGGKAYYFTPIKHDNIVQQDINAVIRNHVYKVSINSISGIGTPIPDPEKEIVTPVIPPKQNAYVDARVEILKWRVVSQSVNINGGN